MTQVIDFIGGEYGIEPCTRICNPLRNHSANSPQGAPALAPLIPACKRLWRCQ